MDRVTEATLAFIGTGEVRQRALKASDFTSDTKVASLIADGFVKIDGDALICTPDGWRHLDSRPSDA